MIGLEIAASISGFVAVWLTITRNIWCWPIGLVQVLLYIFVFYCQKFYSDCLLHVVYVFLQIYGWYSWSHTSAGEATDQIVVERLSGRSFCLSISLVVIGTIAWGNFMARFTDAVVPYGDAFTTVASLLAQVLLARKKMENWVFWVAVDVVAIGLYGYRGLYPTMVLYTLFLGMAMLGLAVWRQQWQRQVAKSLPLRTRPEIRTVREISVVRWIANLHGPGESVYCFRTVISRAVLSYRLYSRNSPVIAGYVASLGVNPVGYFRTSP